MKPEERTLTHMEAESEFSEALRKRLAYEYNLGLVRGLSVARHIRERLTRQPDGKWQKAVRQWADKEIQNAEQIYKRL